jgi:hypothetical protein
MSGDKNTHTVRFVDEFVKTIDVTREYSLDEIRKTVGDIYKSTKKPNKKKVNSDGEVVKRQPSPYNVFIKNEMAKLKQENPECDNKEIMKLAAAAWKKSKETPSSDNKTE